MRAGTLASRALKVAIVNAKRVRDFAKASGRLAKTDRVDAEGIARYGAFARPAAVAFEPGSTQPPVGKSRRHP